MSKTGKKTNVDKVVLPVEMPRSIKEIIENLAKEEDVSQASIVRRAIKFYLTNNPQN